NICSTYARIIADDVPEVVLVGRADSEARLAKVAKMLFADAWKRITTQPARELTGLAKAISETGTVRRLRGEGTPADAGAALFQGLKEEFGDHRFVRLAPGLEPLRECDVIVTATSSAEPVIFPEHLAAGPVVVCDLAVPP